MKDINALKQNHSQFLSMTSLTVEEFELLHDKFEGYCEDYFFYHTIRGKIRKKICYQEQKNTSLKGSEMKLLFLLSYLKNYPLQQFHASYFGITQGKVSQLIKVLHPILEKTLISMGLMPSGNSEELRVELDKYQVKEANMDATERDVNRSTDYVVQKEFYSGKKKRHTIKNNLLTEPCQYILYLSDTYEGTVHDKKICDIEEYSFPERFLLRYDLGYVGYNPENVTIEKPYKNTKLKPLTEPQKLENKIISGKRVTVEQAISGVKRLKVIADKIRTYCREFRNSVMRIACAIHNLRVRSHVRAYTCTRTSINFK
jgi:hypothetical protein